MMKMAHGTNEALDKIFKERPNHLKVSCFTCHHGIESPRRSRMPLAYPPKDGPDAAPRYRDLRKEYYGSRTRFHWYALVG